MWTVLFVIVYVYVNRDNYYFDVRRELSKLIQAYRFEPRNEVRRVELDELFTPYQARRVELAELSPLSQSRRVKFAEWRPLN